MVIIVLGVSGVGKSTVGKMLAKRLGLPFYDADAFHPQSNINKMQNGVALDDYDRGPWLLLLATKIKRWYKGKGAVLACSALKESYRETLKVVDGSNLKFVFLSGNYDLIEKRLLDRTNHFF